MNVRFQKTRKGEVAILPRKEYDTLVAKAAEADEDTATARLVAAGRREIADGAPQLPKQVVDRLASENAIRVLREWRNVTQIYLASRTGLSQGHISDIETGRRTGTPAALRSIASALKVPIDRLID
ncbi:MAG: helix-turn-helix transcriptional regulator [Bauldia sp.]